MVWKQGIEQSTVMDIIKKLNLLNTAGCAYEE